MGDLIEIQGLTKTYAGGFQALKGIDLSIRKGEILALLGPNGAGKTTLIGIICGLVNPSSGTVRIDQYDVVRDFRKTRERIGLVPQELSTDSFELVCNAVAFSRGLFGKRRDPAVIERVLRDLSLWDKRDNQIITLSGGMKRRVLIAKALAHEPDILFLDEPTAGVDVELRQDMWRLVERMRADGVTIILTTHYIEEAEAIADRVGVINRGELILVEDKHTLMQRLGRKQLAIALNRPIDAVPSQLAGFNLELNAQGDRLLYTYDGRAANEVASLLRALDSAGLAFDDLDTQQSSLEDIFVNLVRAPA
ncbi:MAG: ABC transporter ATP-binding protein [Burkholderiaceae bacterium]